ncbi:hypothetical protein ABIB25_001973 [Nakamurella sp. UYEF19]|uniref:hypothetical protein n=1 Tax=Nakamurella sp. UYEF19 TaxID=1756392 RepID=UPI003393928D
MSGSGPANRDEDVAAVLAVVVALAASHTRSVPSAPSHRSVWGQVQTGWPVGENAWWASGLDR